jgi:hypothetical protein
MKSFMPEFPATTIRFRNKPLILARFIAVPRIMCRHPSSLKFNNPSISGQSNPGFGWNAGLSECGALLFHGQTS